MRLKPETTLALSLVFWLGAFDGTEAETPPPAATASQAAPPAFVPPRTIPADVMKNWPVYPPAARQASREGVVMLRVKISAEGVPQDVSIAQSSRFGDLDAAAVAAVRNWRFVPATRDGTAIEMTVTLPINFSLKKAAPPSAPTAAKEGAAKTDAAKGDASKQGAAKEGMAKEKTVSEKPAKEKPKEKPSAKAQPKPKPAPKSNPASAPDTHEPDMREPALPEEQAPE